MKTIIGMVAFSGLETLDVSELQFWDIKRQLYGQMKRLPFDLLAVIE
jgi:hypothetical protein